jgi:hypothetical protein
MGWHIYILFFFVPAFVNAQTDEEKLIVAVKAFHQDLVKKNTVSLNQVTDKALNYGHSNGWIETKTEMIKNLETGHLGYLSYKEDSIVVTLNGTMANVRFNADIEATLDGVPATYRLKVLEVWVRKGKRWVLFARQSVKR